MDRCQPEEPAPVETMMLEDPATAVERIYRELYARARQVALTNENSTELASR